MSRHSFPWKNPPCFPISRISLIGEAAERFQFALNSVTGKDGALGRCLGTEGLNTVIAHMQNAFILCAATSPPKCAQRRKTSRQAS